MSTEREAWYDPDKIMELKTAEEYIGKLVKGVGSH